MQPKIIIIAGPNGAGKTTFAREFLPREAGCPVFVNADLIAAGLSPFAPERAAVQAGRLTLDAIARGLQSSLTVLLDHEQPLDLLRDIEGALNLLREAEPAQRDEAIRVINAILSARSETPSEDK